MTIGVGFKCNDGIVLAADTQYTRGAYKGHGPKIFPLFAPIERPDLAVVIAGAGRVSFMRRAVAKIEVALGAYSYPSLSDVQQIIESELINFYQTYIYPSPRPDDFAFQLIAGVWTQKDRYGLFQTDDITVNPIAVNSVGHCTIGMGFSVADYALGLTIPRGGINVENAKFIAPLCVKSAKDYVDYCGGRTIVWTLQEDGSGFRVHKMLPIDVKDAEQYSEDLFDTLRTVLELLDPDSLFDDDSIKMVTDMLKDSVISFRAKQKDRREKLRNAKEKAEAMRTSLARLRQQQSGQTP